MRVPARIFASETLLAADGRRASSSRSTNVACAARHRRGPRLCMPDVHWGYGFPIGGVAAFDADARRHLAGRHRLRHQLRHAPRCAPTSPRPRCGRACASSSTRCSPRCPPASAREGFVRLDDAELRRRACARARAGACGRATAGREDLDAHRGRRAASRAPIPAQVSARAIERGRDQLGTLGSGNHYLEIQVLRPEGRPRRRARRARFGLDAPGQVVVMLHCGSPRLRPPGRRPTTSSASTAGDAASYGIDRAATASSPARRSARRRGRRYFARDALRGEHRLRQPPGDHAPRARGVRARLRPRRRRARAPRGLRRLPQHRQARAPRRRRRVDASCVVHRKGATRAFGPGAPGRCPRPTATIGQPVIIGGSMETGLGAARRHGARDGGDLRLHRPRRRPHDVARARPKRGSRGETSSRTWRRAASSCAPPRKSGSPRRRGSPTRTWPRSSTSLHRLDISRKVVSLTPIGNIKG